MFLREWTIPLFLPIIVVMDAYDRALRLLSQREHTEKEIRRKLGEKGCGREEIDSAVSRLIAEGSLSEERFAESFIRSRLRRTDADEWRSTGTKAGKDFAAMLEHYIDNTIGGDDTYVHDPSAVICAIHPEYFRLLDLPMTVELYGPDRGRTIGDELRILEKEPKTRAAVDVDSRRVEAELRMIADYFRSI